MLLKRIIPRCLNNYKFKNFRLYSSEAESKPAPVFYGPEINKEQRKFLLRHNPIPKMKFEDAYDYCLRMSNNQEKDSFHVYLKLKIDPRKADQKMVSYLLLPHDHGSKINVAVFCSEEEREAADLGGAVVSGEKTTLDYLNEEKNLKSTKIVLATQKGMRNVAKMAKKLGMSGKIPSKKMKTIVTDQPLDEAVKEAKNRLIPYQTRKNSVISFNIGHVKMGEEKIYENMKSAMEQIHRNRPNKVSRKKFILEAKIKSHFGSCVPIFSGFYPIVETASLRRANLKNK